MTLEQRIIALAQAIGADIKAAALARGDLSALTTTSKASLVAAGLDPDNLPQVNAAEVRARGDRQTRWKHIWGAGQGVGNIQDLPGTAELVDRLTAEYKSAREETLKRFA